MTQPEGPRSFTSAIPGTGAASGLGGEMTGGGSVARLAGIAGWVPGALIGAGRVGDSGRERVSGLRGWLRPERWSRRSFAQGVVERRGPAGGESHDGWSGVGGRGSCGDEDAAGQPCGVCIGR